MDQGLVVYRPCILQPTDGCGIQHALKFKGFAVVKIGAIQGVTGLIEQFFADASASASAARMRAVPRRGRIPGLYSTGRGKRTIWRRSGIGQSAAAWRIRSHKSVVTAFQTALGVTKPSELRVSFDTMILSDTPTTKASQEQKWNSISIGENSNTLLGLYNLSEMNKEGGLACLPGSHRGIAGIPSLLHIPKHCLVLWDPRLLVKEMGARRFVYVSMCSQKLPPCLERERVSRFLDGATCGPLPFPLERKCPQIHQRRVEPPLGYQPVHLTKSMKSLLTSRENWDLLDYYGRKAIVSIRDLVEIIQKPYLLQGIQRMLREGLQVFLHLYDAGNLSLKSYRAWVREHGLSIFCHGKQRQPYLLQGMDAPYEAFQVVQPDVIILGDSRYYRLQEEPFWKQIKREIKSSIQRRAKINFYVDD